MEPGALALIVRQGAGFSRLQRGVLQVTGSEARSFLNGLLTNDLLSLSAGGALYAALLNHHGRVLADLWVYDVGEGFLLDLEAAQRPKVLRLLQEARVSEDVQLLDRSEDFIRLRLAGSLAQAVIRDSMSSAPPDVGRWVEGPSCFLARTDHPIPLWHRPRVHLWRRHPQRP